MKYEPQNEHEKRMYEIFEELGIEDYEVRNHVAVRTIDEVDMYGLSMEGLNLKNLLIYDKKLDKYFLVIVEEHRRLDMKHFKEITGWKKTKFAEDEEAQALMGLETGLTPLALFNDTEKRITVVLGKEIIDAPDDEIVGFHPCRNNGTLLMKKADFIKFLAYVKNETIEETYYPEPAPEEE